MSGSRFRTCIPLAPFLLTLSLPALAAAEQRQPTSEPRVERPTDASSPQVVIRADQDARETRESLEELLRRLPPAVGRVLRTDPSLLSNESYLAPYPTLAQFIKQHPEIRGAPGFFFEHVGPAEFWVPSQPETREAQALRVWRDMMEFFAIAGVVLTITFALIWIVRTLVEYRRWHRASKVHTEVHNKLLDRFTANEDLMAYIQTPAGRRFLESAPLAIDAPPRPVGAPFSRILWSIQVGLVLGAGALGLLYVSGRVLPEVAQPLFALGVLALAVGVGFVASAAASFLLSRRLGLFEPVGTPREHSELPSR
jgi:hypothetical protein